MKKGDHKDRFLIFGFLRKMLNNEEEDSLRERLKAESFQEDVSEETVRQYSRVQLKSKLENIHSKVVEEEKRKRKVKIFALAVLVVLLAFVSWLYLSDNGTNKSSQPNQIFASYFEPYESLFDKKGEQAGTDKGFTAAMKAYSEENFRQSAILFENSLGDNLSKRSLYTFYYGVALLANDQSEKAIDVLQKLYDDSSSKTMVPNETIQWYLALAYLNENEILETKLLLENLTSRKKTNFKQKEAKEILRMLEDQETLSQSHK